MTENERKAFKILLDVVNDLAFGRHSAMNRVAVARALFLADTSCKSCRDDHHEECTQKGEVESEDASTARRRERVQQELRPKAVHTGPAPVAGEAGADGEGGQRTVVS